MSASVSNPGWFDPAREMLRMSVKRTKGNEAISQRPSGSGEGRDWLHIQYFRQRRCVHRSFDSISTCSRAFQICTIASRRVACPTMHASPIVLVRGTVYAKN
jgi:hypothetical protein